MSIYNRSYMRDDFRPSNRRPFNAVLFLVLAFVVVYVVQMVFRGWVQAGLIERLFGLSLGGVLDLKLHTLLTYGYLHDTNSPLHLIINSVFLYIFGRTIQEESGSTRLMEFFHFCVLVGALAVLAISFVVPRGLTVGASAGVSGVIALFALHRWNTAMEILLFFVLPVRLTGKTLFFALLAIEAFFFFVAELPGIENTAYSAHLGGILAAVLYERYLMRRPTLTSWFQARFATGGGKAQSAPRRTVGNPHPVPRGGRFKLNLRGASQPKPARPAPATSATTPNLRGEVDRILDKINDQGFGALSAEEKRILEEAKDRLK